MALTAREQRIFTMVNKLNHTKACNDRYSSNGEMINYYPTYPLIRYLGLFYLLFTNPCAKTL